MMVADTEIARSNEETPLLTEGSVTGFHGVPSSLRTYGREYNRTALRLREAFLKVL
jgi:hypothetical protein